MFTRSSNSKAAQVRNSHRMFRHFVGSAQQSAQVIPLPGDQRIAGTVGHGHGESNIACRDGQLLQIDVISSFGFF